MAVDGEIDFQGFDRARLEDALRRIDRTRYPLNYQRALAELARRGGTPAPVSVENGSPVVAPATARASGVVILTDELVALAQDDDELRGVFAHEVGHLVHWHAMRMLVQSSASALLLVGVFGDVGTASSLTAAAPTVLVSAAYSRDFERQADGFAFQWMTAHQISPRHLGDLLGRIAAKQGAQSGGYLASHPDLAERTRAAAGRH